MSNLAQLQRALQAHVLDDDSAIEQQIESSDAIPAATRLQIYADAYRLRLIEALEANYPVMAKVLGAEAFNRLAQQYLAVNPSHHFSIRWFGHQLAEFLCALPEYTDRAWLAELADWEWKIAASFDERDEQSLRIEHLGNVLPEQWPTLRFAVHPSVRRVSLTSNVVAMVKAVDANAAPPTPAQLLEANEWLIWRRDLSVQYRSLVASEAAAIDALIAGANFSELCESLAEFVDEADVPSVAAGFLQQWIADQLLADPLLIN
jgi:hypothetical protein